MISGQTFLGDGLFMWGQGADGDVFVLESTGLSLGGFTLFRVVPGTVPGGGELLVEDGAMELLFDDATGDVLYEG